MMNPESLESRDMLSASSFGMMVAAEVAPLEARQSPRKSPGLLTGTWSIDTEFGTLEIDSVQKGKKVKGTIDLSPANLSSLAGAPASLSILDGLTLPTIEYVGKFKGGVLQVDFKTTLDLPIIGSLKIAGSLSGTVDLASQTLNGRKRPAEPSLPAQVRCGDFNSLATEIWQWRGREAFRRSVYGGIDCGGFDEAA